MRKEPLSKTLFGPIASGRWSSLFLLSVCWSLVLLVVESAEGRQQGERVVTLSTGIQYEGRLFDFPVYSESAISFAPFVGTTNQIVMVADGLRNVMFGFSSIGNIGGSLRNELQFDIKQRVFKGDDGYGVVSQYGPFNEFGHRVITVVENNGGSISTKEYIQGITKITPRYCELETLLGTPGKARAWSMSVATSTVPRSVLRRLLINRLGQDNFDVNMRYDVADFFRQTLDFEQARSEYLAIEREFPDQKERVKGPRDRVRQLEGRQILSEVKTRLDAGQPILATTLAKTARKDDLANDIRAEYEAIQTAYLDQQAKVQEVRKQVMDLIGRVKNAMPELGDLLQRFSSEMESELSPLNVDRLVAFTQNDNDATPDTNKIALAISGWLLGSNLAETNLAVVESMFVARDLSIEYLQETTSDIRRQQILASLRELEAGNPRYIDAMLKQAKPVDPVDLANYNGSKPIEFFVELPGTRMSPEPWRFQCLAHLPPEYSPYKKYPMILTLPDGGPLPLEQYLNFWCGTHNEALSSKLNLAVRNGHAMRQGYIVVAVDWRSGTQKNYGYSAIEHRVINEALYSSLRKFSVDTDKVFLAGHGTGGDAAYDIGIAHPEHFAGVLGFSGKMGKYTEFYTRNEHVRLPFYCVLGEKDFAGRASMKRNANYWLKSKFLNELTLVEYKGRPFEYFLEDIPESLKWMRGQRRRWPGGPGFELQCKTLRNTDSYFWFYEIEGIPEVNVVEPLMFNRTDQKNEFVLEAKILGPNNFKLSPNSLNIKNKTTLWLSPEFFDFGQRLNIQGRAAQKLDVKPSTETLLNDVLRRADTGHPYWAGVELVSGKWTPINE